MLGYLHEELIVQISIANPRKTNMTVGAQQMSADSNSLQRAFGGYPWRFLLFGVLRRLSMLRRENFGMRDDESGVALVILLQINPH